MKARIILFTLLLAGLNLVACGGASAQRSASGPQSAGGPTSGPGKLVIYCGRSETLIQPLIDQFRAATGIEVEVRYGSTAELAGVLMEEGANSPADLYYAQDPGGLGAVAAAGLLQPLPDALLSAAPERFRAADGAWLGISGRARVVVYNTEAITNPVTQLPTDIYDFVDPAWEGRLGWAPTNASFQAMVTAMRQV